MTRDPEVDVVIPVHTGERPIARAVASVVAGTRSRVRVTVVCHGVSQDEIALALGPLVDDDSVRLLAWTDGLRSPAGPINHGLDAATAPFTALLDSDDTYERGAVDGWIAVQRRDDSDAVIPRFRYPNGSSTRTPPTRPFRRRGLDGVRDRLAYRTRLHGLTSRARFGDIRMTVGLASGEDVVQGATVWYSGARISYASKAPAYLIHVDGGERTSAANRPASESLAFLDALLDPALIEGWGAAARDSLGVKLLRTHIMDIARASLAGGHVDELADVAEAVSRIDAFAPGARRALSRRDDRILEALGDPRAIDGLRTDLALRTDYRRLANLLPRRVRDVGRREAPLRFLAATALSP